MEFLKTPFKRFMNQAKKAVVLQDSEKEQARQNVLGFMRQYPAAPAPVLATKVSFSRYAFAGLAVAVLVGGAGVSFAAQQSLPGDPLYSVKVGVNEKVLGFMKFSDEAKANYEVSLAATRLQEAEKVVAENKLDDSNGNALQNLLNGHIAKAKQHALQARGQDSDEFSAQINSELEASLNAHANVLNILAGKKNSKAAQNIQKVITNLEAKAGEVKKDRQDDEQEVSQKSVMRLKVAAQVKMDQATQALAAINDFLAEHKSDISADLFAKFSLNINEANAMITQGKAEVAAGQYGVAFAHFQQALRMIQETRIALSAGLKFHIDVPFKGDSGDDGPDNDVNSIIH